MFKDYVGKTIKRIENTGNEVDIRFTDGSGMLIYPLGSMEIDGELGPAGLIVFKRDTENKETAVRIEGWENT